jgi:hypothetical protein
MKSSAAQARIQTVRFQGDISHSEVNDFYSLEDYFRDIPRPTSPQNISKLWRSVLGLSLALIVWQRSLRNKESKYEPNLRIYEKVPRLSRSDLDPTHATVTSHPQIFLYLAPKDLLTPGTLGSLPLISQETRARKKK